MQTFTGNDLLKMGYTPRFSLPALPSDWRGTVLDALRSDDVPTDNKLNIVCREEFLTPRTLRLFAVACARSAAEIAGEKRVAHVLDTAERFANGEASTIDLDAAFRWVGIGSWYNAAWDSATCACHPDARKAAIEAAFGEWCAAIDANTRPDREMETIVLETQERQVLRLIAMLEEGV